MASLPFGEVNKESENDADCDTQTYIDIDLSAYGRCNAYERPDSEFLSAVLHI